MTLKIRGYLLANFNTHLFLYLLPPLLLINCNHKRSDQQSSILKPIIVTDKVTHDSDDPAIWYNKNDP